MAGISLSPSIPSPDTPPRVRSCVNVEISCTRKNPVNVMEAVRQLRKDLINAKILHQSDKIVMEKRPSDP